MPRIVNAQTFMFLIALSFICLLLNRSETEQLFLIIEQYHVILSKIAF